MDRWYKSAFEERQPIGTRTKSGGDIRKKSQRQPLKGPGDQAIGTPNLQGENKHHDQRHKNANGDRNKKIKAGGDGADIHAGVDRVGDQEKQNDRVEQQLRIVFAQDAG